MLNPMQSYGHLPHDYTTEKPVVLTTYDINKKVERRGHWDVLLMYTHI